MSGYETRDLSPRRIGALAAGLFAGVGASALLVWLMFVLLPRDTGPWSMAPATHAAVPLPRLEVHEGKDRTSLEEMARARLEGYGWADQAAGRAHIPIGRAMELQVELGWPDRAGGKGTP